MKAKEFHDIIKERGFDYALFKIVRDYEDNGQGLSKEEEQYLKNTIEGWENLDENFTNIHKIFEYKINPKFENQCWINRLGLLANVGTDGKVYPNIVEIDKPEFCIGSLYEQSLEEMWNTVRHNYVKGVSDKKWLNGECKNCRAMSYNRIINQMMATLPKYFYPFI